MNLGQVVERIRFSTATASDLTGRSANNQFSNSNILMQLKFSLDEFAKKTKYFEYFHTQAVTSQQNFVDFPARALRAQSILSVIYYLTTIRNQLSVQNIANTMNHFNNNNYSGVPGYAFIYGTGQEQKMELFPRPQQTASNTTLAQPYKKGDANIELVSSAGFLIYKGRITIGDTKFEYERVDSNTLRDVVAVEETEDKDYGAGEPVYANNLWILYAGIHPEFPTYLDNITDIVDTEIIVPDEYIETIVDYATYKLLLKIDSKRAADYRVNWDGFIRDAEYEIAKGRGNERKNGAVRSTGGWETGYLNRPMG